MGSEMCIRDSYRIFYGNGENMFVNVSIISITIPGQIGEMISVRSESAHVQLPSELITVTVTVTCEFTIIECLKYHQ